MNKEYSVKIIFINYIIYIKSKIEAINSNSNLIFKNSKTKHDHHNFVIIKSTRIHICLNKIPGKDLEERY